MARALRRSTVAAAAAFGAQTNQPTLGQLDHTLLFVDSNSSFIQRRRSPKIHHATQDEEQGFCRGAAV